MAEDTTPEKPSASKLRGIESGSVESLPSSTDPGTLPLVAPGLFDLQINGHGGTWFSDESLTPEKVIRTLEPHYKLASRD